LLLRGNSGYLNATQCYVTSKLHVLLESADTASCRVSSLLLKFVSVLEVFRLNIWLKSINLVKAALENRVCLGFTVFSFTG